MLAEKKNYSSIEKISKDFFCRGARTYSAITIPTPRTRTRTHTHTHTHTHTYIPPPHTQHTYRGKKIIYV